jgi:arsenate reductase
MLVYHNQSCSKSRGALEILADRGVDHDIVEYLKAPPDRAALERIVNAVDGPPGDLVRRGDGGFADRHRRAGACDGAKGNDRRFEELRLSAADYTTREAVIELLLEHPELMHRPVIFRGERAVIARPSEKVLELLD